MLIEVLDSCEALTEEAMNNLYLTVGLILEDNHGPCFVLHCFVLDNLVRQL